MVCTHTGSVNPTTGSVTPTAGSARKKVTSSTAGFADLAATKHQGKKEFGLANNTKHVYNSKISQAKAWLKDQCDAEENFELPTGCPENMDLPEDWSISEFRTALDWKPNRLSPFVLSLFITVRCFVEGLKVGVAEQAQAAFKHYWEEKCKFF